MDNFGDVSVGIAGVGAVTALAFLREVTSLLRSLFNLDGPRVRWLITGLAVYIFACWALTQTTAVLWGVDVATVAGWAGFGVYGACVLARIGIALHEAEKVDQAARAARIEPAETVIIMPGHEGAP